MKKHIFLTVILCMGFTIYAQNVFKEFAPIGATWYYDHQEQLLFDARGYVKYTVEKDTLISGKNVKKVSVNEAKYNSTENFSDNIFIYVENSKVYQYDNNELILIYDFTLEPGDTLEIAVNKLGYCDSVTPIILDSIGIMLLDDDTIRIQYLSYKERYFEDDPDFNKHNIKLFEKIGCGSEFLFKPYCSDEGVWTSSDLRCYIDNEINYVSSWWTNWYPGAACNELINRVSVPDFDLTKQINIFPNPVNDFLYIDYNSNCESDFNIELFNLNGDKIIQEKNSAYIDMCAIPSGAYLLRVSGLNASEVFKIVKK